MNLPQKRLKSTRGQVLILFLLVLVLGLAIVLSVASRTVTDLRTSTTSDESNRAYFAAEAGLEEALQQIESTGSLSTPLSLDFTDISTQATTQEVTPSVGAGTIFVYPFPVERDDVAQVMMLNNPNDKNDGWTGSLIKIWWGTDPAGVNLTNQAIEVSVVYYDNGFFITKFAFDPVSTRGNNFCSIGSGVNTESGVQLTDDVTGNGTQHNFYYSAELNIKTGAVGGGASDACPPVVGQPKHGGGIGSTDPVYLRIRPLYNEDPIPVAVESTDAAIPLPNQAFVIESTGQTVSGVTRKIRAISLFPALPAFFDYVLLNAGSSSLEKD